MRPTLVYVTTIPMTLELLMKGQIAFMKSRGFRVIAVSSPGPALDRTAARDEIEVFGIPMARNISPFADLKTLLMLWRLFRTINPTIAHASTGKGGPLAIIASYMARVPIKVYSLRGMMVDRRRGLVGQGLKLLERVSCGLADRVLSVSASVADRIVEMGLCQRGKIVTPANGSSNGVDAEGRFNPDALGPEACSNFRKRFDIPAQALVTGFVGRIVAGKGFVELIRAWEIVKAVRDDAFLLVAGPLEHQDPVPDWALRAMKEDRRIVWIEYVAPEDMPVFYEAVDLIVLPSYSEGFPNVLLEAAAMRTPVVASKVTGCVDAVQDGRTGKLVPVRNANDLAEAIMDYLSDPELRSLHGIAARERVLRDFRPKPVWEAVLAEYELLLDKKGITLPELDR